ncbi:MULTISPECIES: HAMP domain-containing protein [Deinococcus]|uniref:HAMP domain-containing protein n=1 Tax=Deinococcus rufus TaxID=2136097 RepID=A0ABV7Z614_9DEIO|nr:HAMP domain-containing protein [Deinococcus sp. AB2017081]WQE96353.1 hypothetical protein U2P90_05505 [Deinococcus sp. AB2017081]
MTVTTTPAPLALPRVPRRVGLHTKALLTTVLPVLALGLLTAVILTVQRRAELGTINRALGQTVSSLLASTLDVQDLNLVDTQLRAAVAPPSVAFVDVQPAGDAPRYFTSDDRESDWVLRPALDAFLREQPGRTQFTWHDTRADAYRAALSGLQPGTPDSVREHLQARVEALSATQGQATAYQVTQVGVYETPAGSRALQFPGDAQPPGTLLFHLTIGVTLGELNAALARQLQLVLLACAAIALLAAAVAWRSVRRLVRVIIAITAAAQHASLGHLGDPITVKSGGRPDELTDLVTAIERLRVSLHLALSRLRPAGPSTGKGQ